MNNQKAIAYMIVLGIIILGIFTYVTVLNIFDDKSSSNQFFSKTKVEANATIEDIQIINEKIVITTSGNSKEICIKTTRTSPKINSVCWSEVTDNSISLPIYINKKYYIWIKDSNNNISNYTEYNS